MLPVATATYFFFGRTSCVEFVIYIDLETNGISSHSPWLCGRSHDADVINYVWSIMLQSEHCLSLYMAADILAFRWSRFMVTVYTMIVYSSCSYGQPLVKKISGILSANEDNNKPKEIRINHVYCQLTIIRVPCTHAWIHYVKSMASD